MNPVASQELGHKKTPATDGKKPVAGVVVSKGNSSQER